MSTPIVNVNDGSFATFHERKLGDLLMFRDDSECIVYEVCFLKNINLKSKRKIIRLKNCYKQIKNKQEEIVLAEQTDNDCSLHIDICVLKYGDIVVFEFYYRITNTFIINENKEFLYLGDYDLTGAGYLTIPYIITKNLENSIHFYSKVPKVLIEYIEMSKNDTFLNSLPLEIYEKIRNSERICLGNQNVYFNSEKGHQDREEWDWNSPWTKLFDYNNKIFLGETINKS